MITDPVPRKVEKLAEYKKSDAIKSIVIPSDDRFYALAIETAESDDKHEQRYQKYAQGYEELFHGISC